MNIVSPHFHRPKLESEGLKYLSCIACRIIPVQTQVLERSKMECAKCKEKIEEGDEREHNNEILCEDCYMDVLSPTKFCDPWADYTAKSFIKHNPNSELSENQVLIMNTLREHGEVDPLFLMEHLKDKILPEDGERECAALHRMGKILIQNNDGNVIIKLA